VAFDEHPKFACQSCGRQYRWKPEMAGRSAKCACGAKLVVPTEAPAAVPAPPPAPAPAAPAAKANAVSPAPPKIVAAATPASSCPICKSPVAAGAVLCVKCGYNFKTGKRLAAVVVETDAEEDEVEAAGADAKSSSSPARSSSAPPDKGAAGAG
jgi:hypothetical protein